MKTLYYLLIFLTVLVSCNSDDNQNNDEDPDLVLNITSFGVRINSPIKTRDYSYHNGGYYGIFENPDSSKVFNGRVLLSYGNNSAQINATDIQIIWRSSIDGVLFQGLETFFDALIIFWTCEFWEKRKYGFGEVVLLGINISFKSY